MKIVGQCIYCRRYPSDDDPLSDEHILPFSIYGENKLRKASCKLCAAITSAFEGKVMQDLATVRHVLNFPTRHRRRRNELTLPVEIVTTKDEKNTIYVPPNEYFPLIALPAFNPPAHVSNKEYESGIELIGVSSSPGKRSYWVGQQHEKNRRLSSGTIEWTLRRENKKSRLVRQTRPKWDSSFHLRDA